MGNGNRDCEEERTLLGDLPRGWPKPISILEYDKIPFYDGRFSNKRFIKWLAKLEAYFISTRFFIKVGLVTCKLFYGVRELWFEFLDFRTCICKLFYGVRELWFEFLDFRTCIDTSLIQSWQDLRQSLILKFIQDDYEEILY
jgi:hypothetical protein